MSCGGVSIDAGSDQRLNFGFNNERRWSLYLLPEVVCSVALDTDPGSLNVPRSVPAVFMLELAQ